MCREKGKNVNAQRKCRIVSAFFFYREHSFEKCYERIEPSKNHAIFISEKSVYKFHELSLSL